MRACMSRPSPRPFITSRISGKPCSLITARSVALPVSRFCVALSVYTGRACELAWAPALRRDGPDIQADLPPIPPLPRKESAVEKPVDHLSWGSSTSLPYRLIVLPRRRARVRHSTQKYCGAAKKAPQRPERAGRSIRRDLHVHHLC